MECPGNGAAFWKVCHKAAGCAQVLAAAVVGRRSLQQEPGGQQALHEAQALHRATKALCKVWSCPLHPTIPSRTHHALQLSKGFFFCGAEQM